MAKRHTVESFLERHRRRAAMLEKRKTDTAEKYPEIKNILDDINRSALDAIISDISREKFEEQLEDRRENLRTALKARGLAPDWLDENPECEICGDRGFIDGHTCTCLERYLRMNSEDDTLSNREGRFEDFDFNLFSQARNAKGISPRENMRRNRAVALEFVKGFDDKDTPSGFIFSGEAGTGKSFLAASIAREVSKNHSIMFLTAREFEDRIKNFSNPNLYEDKSRMYECDLLVLDDLGIETQSDFMNGEILKLIEDRMINRRKLIITTNLSLMDIRDKYKSRIYSRLVSDFIFLRFFGDDIRIQKRIKKSRKG